MLRTVATPVLLAGAIAAAAWTVDAAADDPTAARQRLDDVRGAIEQGETTRAELASEAARQAAELERLRTESSAAAAAAQVQEAAMSELEAELAALAVDHDAKTEALIRRRAQLGDTLAALQRMALRPTAALLVSPGDPNDVIRSGLLLRTAVPQIERQTTVLRGQLAEIAALRQDMVAKRAELEDAAVALAHQRERLTALATAKAQAYRQTESARKAAEQRIASLVDEAKSLEDLLDRLNRAAVAVPRPKPQLDDAPRPADDNLISTPRLPPITEARGRLTPPAHGVIVKDFGIPTETGGKTRGVTWRTRPAATVVAPWEGRVVFAGEFRTFGRILIIDHGEGYHSLIAGLERLDAQLDQWVLAGEPVGVAGSEPSDVSLANKGARVAAGRGDDPGQPTGGATLYVELRHDGQPINPLPWIAASTDRTRG